MMSPFRIELLAADVPQEVVHLGDLGIDGPQVDVGKDHGPDAKLLHGSWSAKPVAARSAEGVTAVQSAGTMNLRLRGRTRTSTQAPPCGSRRRCG
jgi:hypothetical protein